MTVFISVAAASTNLVVSFILLIVELHNRREIRRVSVTPKHIMEHPRLPGTSANLLLRNAFLEVLVFIGAIIIDHDGYG